MIRKKEAVGARESLGRKPGDTGVSPGILVTSVLWGLHEY